MSDLAAVLPPSLALSETADLSAPVSMRWPADVLARADACAARTGLNRSAVLRLAVIEGLPAIERLGQ